jgi:hypothetical protein
MAERCAVFWGSHGCDLSPGHPDADVRHQCGLEDEDGPCSQVTWELDPLLGIERWVWRFASGEDPEDWNPQAFPVTLYGEDAPVNRGTQAEEDRVRQAWQDAGKLAVYRSGQGWVYEVKVKGEAWTGSTGQG